MHFLDLAMRIVIMIFSLGFVVVIHEFGHYLVARWLGVRVERFTVGFGPEILGFTKGDTRYAVCAIPLGGMVKLAGDMMEDRQNTADEFFSQPWYSRIAIALAGPVMNYLLAFALFSLVAIGWGLHRPMKEAMIGALLPGMPAAEAKLLVGDHILSIDGKPVTSWEDMAERLHAKPDQTVLLDVERKTNNATPERLQISLKPKKDAQTGIGLIGIAPQTELVRVGPLEGLQLGARMVRNWTLQPLQYIAQKVRHWEGPKELSGPIGIAQMVTRASREGFAAVLYLIAVISTGLGLFNLFPIPVLDGGHVLLYTIEGILRRPLSAKALQFANGFGLFVVLTIFVYASYQDILRLGFGK